MEQEARIHRHHHAVQFYGTDESLFTTVGAFISEGLIAGQPAIVIATPPHAVAIVEELSRRLIDAATNLMLCLVHPWHRLLTRNRDFK